MHAEPTVFVVDDDQEACKSVCLLVKSMGLSAESFASAEQFLERYEKGRAGCLVTDVRMVGMSGIELIEELNRRQILLPVIVMTAFARTPITIRAIKAGAVTLLEKPYRDEELWDAIRKGLTEDAAKRTLQERREAIRTRIISLTPAERRVMDMVIQGKLNKAIAKELDVSVRTVENRRSEVFLKMKVESLAELVRLVIEADMDSGLPQIQLRKPQG